MNIFKIGCSGIAIGAVLAVSPAAMAQTASEDASAAELRDSTGETIIVTGTRRVGRTATESSIPIDVFSQEDLASKGSSDMNEVLRNLSPSYNTALFYGSSGSAFIRTPTLRGLPGDQVLVLVNGKRRHRSALVATSGGGGAQSVDMSQIPAIAIGQMELLRDGAAAQYGSDAIAGVMNFTLRRESSGLELRAKYGEFIEGDGDTYQLVGNLGLPLGPNGFFNISAEYVKSGATDRGVDRPGYLAFKLTYPNIELPVEKQGVPYKENVRVFVNSGIELNETDELYFFGNYGQSSQGHNYAWRQPANAVGPAKNGIGTSTYTRTNIFNTIYLDQLPDGTYDANGRTFSFAEWFPGGLIPTFKGKVKDVSAAIGYKGSFEFGLNYDLSLSYGQSRIEYSMDNTVNASMGPDSPTSVYQGANEQRETGFNLDFSYPLDVGLASPLTIAFGAERRIEAYEAEAGDEASYLVGQYNVQVLSDGRRITQPAGASGFPGFSPTYSVNESRKSWSLYLDLEADLVESLTVGAAVRHEHYSDFGDTTNFKGSVRWEASSAIAVRGSASSGFKAPTAGQIYNTVGATQFIGGQPVDNITLPAASASAQLYGSSPLKPQKAKNLSAGLVLTPGGGFVLTADYYNIKVSDRIGLTSYFPVTTDAERQALREAGLSTWATVGQLRYFTNSFSTRTQGVDLVATHQTDTGWGRFNSSLSVNYNKTTVTQRDPAIVDNVAAGNIEDNLPKWGARFTERWSLDGFSITGRANYFGKYLTWSNPADGGNVNRGSEVTFDLELRYDINDRMFIAVAADNILNEYPDRDIRSRGLANSNWYEATQAKIDGTRYADNSPIGAQGGFWYVTAGIKF